jgi:hypothetical protein
LVQSTATLWTEAGKLVLRHGLHDQKNYQEWQAKENKENDHHFRPTDTEESSDYTRHGLIVLPITPKMEKRSPHLPHPGPLGSFSQILFLLNHPKIIAGVTAAPGKRPYMIDVVLLRVEFLTF